MCMILFFKVISIHGTLKTLIKISNFIIFLNQRNGILKNRKFHINEYISIFK